MEQMYIMEQIIYCLLVGKVINLIISIYTPYVPRRNLSNLEKMTDERKITKKRTRGIKKGQIFCHVFILLTLFHHIEVL